MAGKHSKYAPSSLHRVEVCPGSWRANLAMPQKDSIYSAKGTFGHKVADMAIEQRKLVAAFKGFSEVVLVNGVAEEFTVDSRLVNALQRYVDWCFEVPGDMYHERKVDITAWTPSDERETGTLDNSVCAPSVLTITDLKLGEGVQVFAKNNLQLIDYALGMYNEFNLYYDFKKIVIRIAQPLLDHFDVWECDVKTLLKWGGYIKQVWIKAAAPDAPFNAEDPDACRFCKINHTCATLAAKVDESHAYKFNDDEEDFEVDDVNRLTDGQIRAAWDIRKFVAVRMKAINDYLVEKVAAGHGEEVRLKMVEGRSNARWRSESAALEAMEEAGIPESKRRTKKVVSPTQAKELVPKAKRKILEAAIVKPPGKPTLADIKDKKPDYDMRHAAQFDDVSDEANEEADWEFEDEL